MSDPNWTPERRQAQRERSIAVAAEYYAIPANLARQGFLQAHERAAIVNLARNTSMRYIDIGLEYLISEAQVSKICTRAGVKRCPQKLRVHSQMAGE